MVSLFRKGGSGAWVMKYFDEHGRRVERSTKTTDRKIAQRMAREVEDRLAKIRAGMLDPREENRAKQERRALAEHVADFIAHLEAKHVSASHLQGTAGLVTRTLIDAGVERISDITPARVQRRLADLRRDGRSARTANAHLVAAKAFTRWLLREGRATHDPLFGVTQYNVATDRRRIRRALTDAELALLVSTAEHGPKVGKLSGPDRAMLYRIAAGTGFRRNEIATLRVESFNLESAPPTITVEAAYSKHRRDDVQPIRQDLAEILRPWLAARKAGALVFPRLSLDRTSDLIRFDLAAAKIPDKTDAGSVDFHSLRNRFISAVIAGKASVKEAQALARHSTPALTLAVYARVSRNETARALEAMAPTPGSSESAAATGTDSRPHQNPHHSPRISATLGGTPRVSVNAARKANAARSGVPNGKRSKKS